MQPTEPSDGRKPRVHSIPHLAQTQQISSEIEKINRVAGDLMLRFIGHGLTAAEQVIELVDKKVTAKASPKSKDDRSA